MSKLILLLKTYAKLYLGALAKKTNKKEYLSGGLILLFIGVIFIWMFSSMAYTTIYEFMKLDPPAPVYALYVLTSTGLIFMVLIVVLKGTSFKKSNDHDLLLSLPISKFIIVLSKILKEYLFDFVSLLFIIMPGYVCYYIFVPNTSFLVVVFGLVVVLLLTLISNAIAIIMNTTISKLTRKLKNAEIFQTIISVLITLCFLVFYFIFNVSMTNSPSFIDKFVNIFLIKWIVNFIAYHSFVDFIFLFILCVIPFIFAVWIEVHEFNKHNSVRVSNQKDLIYKEKNVTMHLFRNECSRYFRSSVYVLNTIIGSFFIFLCAGLIIGFGKERIETMITTLVPNPEMFLSSINGIIVIMITLVSATVITTSASISIEGKYFWILKAHPIDEKQIFNSKLLLNILLAGVPAIISSVALGFVIGFKYLPFMLILSLSSVVNASILGLMNNLKYYRFDWKDESEIIKQSMAVLISMATSIVPGVLILVGFIAIPVNEFIYFGIASLLFVFYDIFMYKRLITKGVKRFKNIN